jgi:hypothetical protein
MRKFLSVTIILAMLLGCAEVLAYLFTSTHPRLFGPSRDQIEEALDIAPYREFLATRYDAELGWQNPRGRSLEVANCLGESKVYSWDDHGRRSGRPSTSVEIIAVGDSFTHGHEASDSEAYPYRLGEVMDVGVANYGVNGFDPLQATLQFERVADRHPEARLAIRGVMFENIARVPNSFRGALRPVTQEPFGFKPFVDISGSDPVVRDNPNAPPAETLEQLRARVEAALEADYWRLPRAGFPYLGGIVQAVQSRLFAFLVQRKVLGVKGAVEYGDPSLVRGLMHVIEQFLASTRARGFRPLVVFLPENKNDRVSPARLIAELRGEHPDALFVNFGEAAIDWDRYNLDGTVCHPSPYGYDQIARFVSAAIIQNGLLGSSTQTAGPVDD